MGKKQSVVEPVQATERTLVVNPLESVTIRMEFVGMVPRDDDDETSDSEWDIRVYRTCAGETWLIHRTSLLGIYMRPPTIVQIMSSYKDWAFQFAADVLSACKREGVR